MSYAASEKLEFIRLDEQPSWSMRPTLSQLGIPPSTFYAWYEHYLARWTLLHFPGIFDMQPSGLLGEFCTSRQIREAGTGGPWEWRSEGTRRKRS